MQNISPTQGQSNGRLHEVDVLRVTAILLVILFHTFFVFELPILKNMAKETHTNIIIFSIDHIISFFRMPLLIFVSGYMFGYLKTQRGKYNDSRDLIKKKFKRLILPYLVFAPITAFCYTLWKTDSIDWTIPIGHLWFIVMLFWCFAAAQLLSTTPIMRKPKFLVSFIILLMILYPLSFAVKDYAGLGSFIKWIWCFLLGYSFSFIPTFAKFRHLKGWQLLLLLLLAFCLIGGVNILSQYNYKIAIAFHPPIMAICVITVWASIFFIGIKTPSKLIASLIACSYGMYVIHMWLLSIAFHHVGLLTNLFGDYSILMAISLLAITLVLSFQLSRLFLKTRIGRYLIG